VNKNETLVWVIYDIRSNRVRRKVIKATESRGLYRVQKSVFLGSINRTVLKSLSMEVDSYIDEEVDSVYIFPMCEQDFKKVILKGQAFDKKLVTDEVKSFFA
jgi:CRISPR-associated protein Cas2